MSLPGWKISEFNTFASNVIRDIDRNQPKDIVTPKRPLWNLLQKKGRVTTKPAGFGPETSVVYSNPDRTVFQSRTSQLENYNEALVDVKTVAQWDHLLATTSFTIPNWERFNSKGKLAIADHIKQEMDRVYEGFKTVQEEILWNGRAKGSDVIWGINNIVAVDPTVNPTSPISGQIGRIDRTDSTRFSGWRNQTKNYNAAYRTMAYGGEYTNMFDEGSSSLLELFWNCSNNADGNYPDLIVANAPFFRYSHRLAKDESATVYYDTEKTRDLGVKTFSFMEASIIRDDKVPDSPGSANYGTAVVLNLSTWEWFYTEGLKGAWEPMVNAASGQTAMRADMHTQFGLICSAPNRNGIFYNVQDQTQTP